MEHKLATLERLPAMRPLAGQAAIITGGGRGLGAAIGARLADDGAQVFVADIDSPAAANLIHTDVADPASVRSLVDQVRETAGRIDILVNNAGISGPAAPVVSYSDADWRRVLSVDLDGVFYC